jgi:hypothetical protein
MSRLRSIVSTFFVFAFLMLFVPTTHAQTRWLVGPEGALDYDNKSVGLLAAVEIPFAKRFELDLKDTFSPIETHVSLGGGRANILTAGGIVWLNQHWGVTGSVADSMYDVTKVTKDGDFASGGFVHRGYIGGLPARVSIKYVQQFNNGITPSGLESSHLQGVQVGISGRYGCTGPVCYRLSFTFDAGKVLTQSNPICDGTYGITGGNGPNGTCYRKGAIGGGSKFSFVLEFPRHRGHEYDVF